MYYRQENCVSLYDPDSVVLLTYFKDPQYGVLYTLGIYLQYHRFQRCVCVYVRACVYVYREREQERERERGKVIL